MLQSLNGKNAPQCTQRTRDEHFVTYWTPVARGRWCALLAKMKPASSESKSNRVTSALVIVWGAIVAFGMPGCGTFSGMSFEERDRANKDLASESNFLTALKPERSLQDNREVPTSLPYPMP